MRLTNVRLVGLNVIDFKLTNPSPTDPYVIKNIDGLGPTDIDVTISNALQTEGFYRHSMPHNRELIFRVKLNPNYDVDKTISDLRTGMYGLMEGDVSGGVSIQFMEGNVRVALATAYVKRFEVLVFTKDPEVQITFACTGAHFVAPDYITLTSTINTIKTVTPGTARVPMVLKVRVKTAVPSMAVRRFFSTIPDPQEFFVLKDVGFLAGDIVTIDTTPGQRDVILYRGSTSRGLIGHVTPESEWPWLDPVLQNEVYLTGTGASDVTLQELKYKPRYWGF